ncbi:hypothetical protein D3C76_1070290 [compost metagenome]
MQVRIVELGHEPRFNLIVAFRHQATVGVEHHHHIRMRLQRRIKAVVYRHRRELFVQRCQQPSDRPLRIGTVDERLADPRIQPGVLRPLHRHIVVALQVLLGIEGVFAVEHRHCLRVLQRRGAVGDRREVAGGIGSNGRCSGSDATAEYGDKSQQGRDSHRAYSFNGEIGITLSSSLGGKTELALLNDGYRANEWLL